MEVIDVDIVKLAFFVCFHVLLRKAFLSHARSRWSLETQRTRFGFIEFIGFIGFIGFVGFIGFLGLLGLLGLLGFTGFLDLSGSLGLLG